MSKARLLTKLKAELVTAVPILFDQLSRDHDDLCCFGLGSTAVVESIVPIYQFENQLSAPDDKQKHCPWEWEMGNGAVDLGTAVPLVRTELKQIHDDSNDNNFGDAYIKTIVAALADLKKKGVFGTPRSQPYLAFWLIGDYEPWVIKSSKILNTPTNHAAALESLG